MFRSLWHRIRGLGRDGRGWLTVSSPAITYPAGTSPAVRFRPRRWADLRLWVGVIMLVASMMVGARVLSPDSDHVVVWQASRDLSAGSQPHGLQPVAVSLGSAVDDYLLASESPEGVLRLPISEGELLPRAAMTDEAIRDWRRVTLGVDPLHSPIDLAPGDLVDVWSVHEVDEFAESTRAQLVLSNVTVHRVGVEAASFGGPIAIELAVPGGQVSTLVEAAQGSAIHVVSVPISSQGSHSSIPAAQIPHTQSPLAASP